MKKILFLIAASVIAVTSCTKSAGNKAPYVCTCNYSYQRGFYWVADTATSQQYASGTSFTDAQLYCNNQQTAMSASTNPGYSDVHCYVHQ